MIPHVALSSWYELFQIGKMRLLIARSSAFAAAGSTPGRRRPTTVYRKGPRRGGAGNCCSDEPLDPLLQRSDFLRQDARQRVVRAVQPDRLPDRVLPAAQALLPERMAHDHRRRTARPRIRFR